MKCLLVYSPDFKEVSNTNYVVFFENTGELRIIILRRKGEAKRNLIQLHTNPHTLG
jgi:hypothetical protein